MASASAIRSPLPLPLPLSEQQSETCAFRRSKSRIFYESECTTGTSWEFRGVNTDSPVLIPVHQMQLSLLRSPIINSGIESPLAIPDATSSLVLNRSAIPSPTKDELSGEGSDGSRNSTGSSTGSHRSQDSGFSDSGESRPSRRSASSTSQHSPHPSIHLSSANRSNQYHENCNQVQTADLNKNYLQQRSSTPLQNQNHSSRSSPFPLTPDQLQSSRQHHEELLVGSRQQSPSIYSQPPPPHHHLYVHERCYSTPVPSPIPHSGSGCGKLILKNASYQKIQLAKSPHPHALHFQHGEQHHTNGDYGEINANGVRECSNCIYQEIVLSQSPQPTYNSPHLHYQSQNRSSSAGGGSSNGNYALYCTVSPTPSEQSGYLGAPVSTSTPKRSNPPSASRLTIMQKIDNFESLNKNKKSLDSNNNNSNNTNSGNSTSSLLSNSKSSTGATSSSIHSNGLSNGNYNHHQQSTRTSTPRNVSSQDHHGHGVSPVIVTAASSHDNSSSSKISSKKHTHNISALSPTSINSNHQHNSTSSSSAFSSITTDFANNDNNKTVLQRIPLPLPISSPTSNQQHHESSRGSDRDDAENNNNLTLNEFSTYASQSQLKACLKVSPKWESLPKGYKRVPIKSSGLSCSYLPSETTSTTTTASGEVANISVSKPTEKVIIVKSHFDNDAMRLWLHELRSQTEPECLHMLQTKSIPSQLTTVDLASRSSSPAIISSATVTNGPSSSSTDEQCNFRSSSCSSYNSTTTSNRNHPPSTSSENFPQGSQASSKSGGKSKATVVQAIHAISSPMMSIRNVERMANVVSGEFAKICKNIEFGFLSQVPNLVLSLVNHVEDFLQTFQGTSSFGNLQKLENKLSRSCRRLYRSARLMLEVISYNDTPNASCIRGGEPPQVNNIYSIIEPEGGKEGYHVAVSEVVDGIVTVGNLFSQVVDLRLTRDLSCILDIVEGGGVPAKVALKSFASALADGGNHLCRLASEIRTVRGLLSVILDSRDNYVKILSLRCLATVLCVGEAVKHFDRAGGFEIVADFMYDSSYSLDLRIEAVSVLTQATDPWIDLETSLGSLGIHLQKIVVALSNLVRDCELSEESFLLVVAAISNLTFLEVASIEILRRCGTVSLIIATIEKADKGFSVFVLDHVATILANMAGVESCRADIVKSGGIHALLNFLQRRPSPSKESAPEIMACERVQQKSTIAISRLCTEEGVAQFILERGGIHRLVMLSRNEKERNYSDGVLIAALATLRKLVTVCGDELIRGLQADDLIQPRLLDSFLLYSSRQESYV